MYLVAAIFFTILAVAIGLIGTIGKTAVAATNPIATGFAFLGCVVAAISYFIRHSRSQTPISAPGRTPQTKDGASKFWIWLSRISSVVGLLAGLLSFGRQLYAMFIGSG